MKRIRTWMKRPSPNRYVSHPSEYRPGPILNPFSSSPNPPNHRHRSHKAQITHNHDPLSINEKPAQAQGKASPLRQNSPSHSPSILPSPSHSELQGYQHHHRDNSQAGHSITKARSISRTQSIAGTRPGDPQPTSSTRPLVHIGDGKKKQTVTGSRDDS